jgi:DNA-binding response OmpR family regulator
MGIATATRMATTQPGAHRRILLVDDDAATRLGLSALLVEAGYAVEPVGTLKAAMESLSHQAPDLVITDVRLQGYNGLQLLAMAPSRVPAIVITGFPDRVLEADAQKMGAEYLVKPVAPKALLAMIHRKISHADVSASFSPARRWARKPVPAQLTAWVQDLPVRILDISYGGLRLAFETTPTDLPRALCLSLPTSNVEIDLNVVWQRPAEGHGWLCGAAIPDPTPISWKQIVDRVAAH